MARPKRAIPAYTEHASGLARIHWNGKDHYLGAYNSPESLAEYARIVAEITSAPAPQLVLPAVTGAVTVDAVLLAFMRWALEHYRRPDGSHTNQIVEFKSTLAPLRALYAHTPAASFGPLALKAVRADMLRRDWCRTQINSRIGKIKRVFKWAASEQLVPVTVFTALATVAGLQAGRTTARESAPIGPVNLAHVEATLPFVNEQVRGLVRFQLLTGCRPGEACRLRACDIDTTAAVWTFEPSLHKTQHHGKRRPIKIGPKAQELIRPLFGVDSEDYLFDPRKASSSGPDGKRAPGVRYTSHAYSVAIDRAAQRAGVPPWSPNQLRKAHATLVRKLYGLEGAQVALGHSNAKVTELYAARDEALAAKIASEIG